MLRSYVQLNVRDRDMLGFVEEAQRPWPKRSSIAAGHEPGMERRVREPSPRPIDDAGRVLPLVLV